MSDLSSTPKPETVLRGHKDAVNCVGFLSDELLSSGSVDGVLKLWSISSRRAVTSINAHSGSSILAINTLFYSASIVTSGRDGFVRLWRMDRESSSSHTSPVLSFPTGARHFCNASCDRGYHSGYYI
jgi:WD40 repeat protein